MIDSDIVAQLKEGYNVNPQCKNLIAAACGIALLTCWEGLWFLGPHLMVPHWGNIREKIFCLAHDSLRHFGFHKAYEALCSSYYWLKMQHDLELIYIPACHDCQRLKSLRSKLMGPLHPLPVLDGRGESIAMDFIGSLLEDEGFNCILSIMDRLHSDIRIVLTRTDLTALELADLFFEHWYCKNGLPSSIVCD